MDWKEKLVIRKTPRQKGLGLNGKRGSIRTVKAGLGVVVVLGGRN